MSASVEQGGPGALEPRTPAGEAERLSVSSDSRGGRASGAARQGRPGRALEADFDAFVAARATTLMRVASVLVKNPHDAEDVVQDVLVKAHLHWASITGAGNPDAYVRRMLVNACTSFWRRAVRWDRMVDVVARDPRSSMVTGDAAGGVADRAQLLSLLRLVPPRQRAVLVFRYYEGLDDAAIADAMGISQVAVRSNASRGLVRLRELLAEVESGGGERR